MKTFIRQSIAASSRVILEMLEGCHGEIEQAAQVVISALRQGHTIYWCGNGGSAGQAQHLSAELIGGLRSHDRSGFRSVSLTTDTSFITAWANDTDYRSIFSRQIETLGRTGDILVGLSTSGNSANVLAAFEAARKLGVVTIAMTGNGGKLSEMADYAIRIPSTDTQRIQEGHILAGHVLCDVVEQTLA